ADPRRALRRHRGSGRRRAAVGGRLGARRVGAGRGWLRLVSLGYARRSGPDAVLSWVRPGCSDLDLGGYRLIALDGVTVHSPPGRAKGGRQGRGALTRSLADAS